MRLPDGKTAVLYSVYEAVSNSIHAINDRFTEEKAAANGKVDVDIQVDSDGDIASISISDNGVGFSPENLASFDTSDSRFKYERGGKGVGRFIWIKLFETIKIDSVYSKGHSKERISFRFMPEKQNSIANKQIVPAPKHHQETKIILSDLRPEQRGRVRPSSYLKDLALHFFPQFIAGTLPQINITYRGDSLATYQFFASDKPIRSLAPGAASTKEPDLIFFNPLGFRREGTTDPVVIVEFKRPGDERLSQHPINQVLQYIDDLRGSQVRDVDGGVVSEISDETPFECIIVCDLTASARRLFERSIAQYPTPDGEGYYGWSSPHKAYIRVMSYKKMLRDAELRNKTFFDQLKLESPSAAAKKRSAKVRERRRVDANQRA